MVEMVAADRIVPLWEGLLSIVLYVVSVLGRTRLDLSGEPSLLKTCREGGVREEISLNTTSLPKPQLTGEQAWVTQTVTVVQTYIPRKVHFPRRPKSDSQLCLVEPTTQPELQSHLQDLNCIGLNVNTYQTISSDRHLLGRRSSPC